MLVGRGFQLLLIPGVDAPPGHAFGLPILEPDWIDQHQLLDVVREGQRVAHAEHAADRMSGNDHARQPKRGEKGMRIAGQLLKAELIMRGLARFAEADLVNGDDAVSSCRQGGDRWLPRGRAKILAVK